MAWRKDCIPVFLQVVFFAGVLFGCVKPFFNGEKYEHILVVEGILTDFENEVAVKLSFSSDFGAMRVEPVSGANVSVVEEDGSSYALGEGKE